MGAGKVLGKYLVSSGLKPGGKIRVDGVNMELSEYNHKKKQIKNTNMPIHP